MSDLKVGDKVDTIDDIVSGTITKIDGDRVTILTEEGFELEFGAAELMVTPGKQAIKVSNYEAATAKSSKETSKPRKRSTPKPKQRNIPKMEVDLHIDQLVASAKGMSNYDMLNLQIETAKRQLEFAIKKRIQKVVFIHGVGSGVLQEELKFLFKKYGNITYYDADYQKYGLGATEIYIYQNPK